MKKTIVKISEGLGNQLFMYAHAYAFSQKMGYDLFVDSKSAYKKLKIRSFLLDHFMINIKYADPLDIPDNFYKYINLKIDKKFDFLRKKKKFLIENKFRNKITNYIDYTHFKYSDKVYIEGYFESEKYFQNYKTDITNQFQVKNIKKDLLSVDPISLKNENSVSIAIRQHRFSEKNNNMNNISKSNTFVKNTVEYILNAVEFIKSKIHNPKFYVFSNDVTNLENLLNKNSFTFVNHTNNKAINDFYLSTLCKHFIVGPSTFHWWSAYLGLDKSKICICPPEHLKFSSNKDILPSDWIKLS
mgnify:CR=1 FL=1